MNHASKWSPILAAALAVPALLAGCSKDLSQGAEKPHDHGAMDHHEGMMEEGGASTQSAPVTAMAKKASAAEHAVQPYTLDTCLVSGEKLGEMGDPIRVVFEGQEFKFCCPSCVKSFRKDPQKYVKALAAATRPHAEDAGSEEHQHNEDHR